MDADKFMEEIPGSFHILKMDEFISMLREPDRLEKNYFLDLRDASKHAENGIDGSLQCLVRQLPAKYRELLPEKNKKIIVYCNGGQMSLYAVMYLKLKGYSDVLSLAGGYNKYLDSKSKE